MSTTVEDKKSLKKYKNYWKINKNIINDSIDKRFSHQTNGFNNNRVDKKLFTKLCQTLWEQNIRQNIRLNTSHKNVRKKSIKAKNTSDS